MSISREVSVLAPILRRIGSKPLNALDRGSVRGAGKTLLVANNATPPGAEQAIRSGQLHRINYLELSHLLPATWVDDSVAGSGNAAINRLEGTLRLDIRQALAVAR